MWWLISALYVTVGLLRFRSKFSSVLKTVDGFYARDYERKTTIPTGWCDTCGHRGCKEHVSRKQVKGEDRAFAAMIALLEALFWLPLFLARVFWKGLFPKGVLAETSKERKARLKKEKAAEEEFLLKQAKELGLM